MSSGASGAAGSPPFASAEAKLPSGYPEPTIKPGATFRVGYLNAQAGAGALDAQQAAALAEVKKLGGTSVAYSANSNPATQAAEFKTLLGQHVTAIVVQPINPVALGPLIAQARAAGIPVVAVATPAIPGPSLPGYAANVMEGVDRCGYVDAQAVAQAKPGATFAMVTSDIPVPAIQELLARTKYWAEKFGLKYVGSVSTGQGLTAAAGSTAMTTIIAQHPSVDSVFTFYDIVAEGAATTQKTRAQGKIKVVGLEGDPSAVQQIRQGAMFATCATRYAEIGRQLVRAAYDAQTKQHLPLAPNIAVPSYVVTKSNRAGSGYTGGN